MRVLYVHDVDIESHGGGAEYFIRELARYMETKGHEAYFAFHLSEGERPGHYKLSRCTWRNPVAYWRSRIDLVDSVVSRQVERLVLEIKPDLVHLVNPYFLSLSPIVTAQKHRIPRLITVQDYWPTCFTRTLLENGKTPCQRTEWNHCFACWGSSRTSVVPRLAGRCLNWLFSDAIVRRMNRYREILQDETLVAVSEFMKQGLVRAGYNDKKIRVIPNAVPRNNKTYPGNFYGETLVLFAGRLEVGKGILTLIEAMPQVLKKFPEATFMVCGGGSLERKLRVWVASHRLEKHMRLMGHLERNQLLRMYRSSTLCVIPSVIAEGLPFSGLDALAAGKPLITTNCGGQIETVIQGKNGLLVDPGDFMQLAEAICMILGDKELALKMGAEGQRLFEQKFSWDKAASMYEALYDGIANTCPTQHIED